MGSEPEAVASEHEVETRRQSLTPTPPNGVSKKTLALWKKQLKNLKTKDAGKKIDGLRYCARDDRFFKEQTEVLPVIIGFLSRVKMPEVIAEALTTFKILFTVTDLPGNEAAQPGAAEGEPPVQLHPDENKQFVVNMSCGLAEGSWKGGEPLVAVLTAAVTPEIKMQAIEVFSILVQHCIEVAASEHNSEPLHIFQTTATPAVALLSCLAVDHAELHLAALNCISLLFRSPPDANYLDAFHSSEGLQKILVSLQRPERRFHRPVLEIIESFSLHENGRLHLRASGAREAIQLLLAATVETTTTTISTATATPTTPITLTAEEATLMHGNVSIACRSLSRMLCAKETPDNSTDFSGDDRYIQAAVDALLALLQRDITTAVSPPPAAPAPAGNNAAAQAAAAAAAATASTLASLFAFSPAKCVDIITLLGRLIEKSEAVKQYAKAKGLLQTLIQAYRLPGESALHQSVDKALHLCAVTVRNDCESSCPGEAERFVDPQIFSVVRDTNMASENAGDPVEKPSLLTVDTVLSILESSSTAVTADGESTTSGVVFRLVRWLAIVVDSQQNAQALGEAAMGVLVKILLDTKPTETVLCGFLSKTIQAIASQSPEACELCSTDARNPVGALVAFLQAAFPCANAMVPHRAVSVASEIETLSPVQNVKSEETIEAEANAFATFKLEWLNEFEEPEVFEPHSLTERCHGIDPFFFAARALEVFARSYTRATTSTGDAAAANTASIDFAELLTQRLEASGKAASSAGATAGKKKTNETVAKSVDGEAIVVCVLEKTPDIFKVLNVFSSKNAEVAVSLLTTIKTLAQLPGGVRALLLLAKTALEASPIEETSESGETAVVQRPFVPQAWPWTREEAQHTEHSWLLAPILAVFQTSVTCFFQLEAAVACLAAITASYEPEPTPSSPPTSGVVSTIEVPINDSDRFVNAALSQGILVYLVAVLDVERVPQCPREHQRRQDFAASTIALALQFIERGTHKQFYALSRRQELLELYDQLTAAAAAAAASATGAAAKGTKQEPVGPTIDVASLHSQKLEYKSRWASELLDATFDVPRFCYRRVTALLLATQIGQVEIAKALLEAGVSPDATSPLDATTPLMLALATRNKPLAQALLDGGASVDSITQDGLDVTVWACALASPIRDDLATLISRIHSSTIGSKVVIQLDALIELDSEDAAPDSELLEAMLKRGLDVNVSNAYGDFLLHALLSKCAVRKRMRGLDVCFRYNSTRHIRDTELLRLTAMLVEHHRAELDACNKLGQTPLHLAMLHGHVDVALYLLGQGANPNIVDCFGFLPLHYACLGFSSDGVQAIQAVEAILAATSKHELREGKYVDCRKHKTPLEKAAVDVDALLDRGFADVSAPPAIARTLATVDQVLTSRSQSPDGLLPWHLSCGAISHLNASLFCLSDEMNARLLSNGGVRATILTHFIQKHGIALHERTSKQLTALHLAVKTDVEGSNSHVIDVLLSQPLAATILNAVHEPTTIDALIPIPEGYLVELTTEDLLYVPHANVSTRSLQHKYHVILPDGTHLENLHRHQLKVSSQSATESLLVSRYMLRLESAFSALHYAIQTSDDVSMKLLDQPGISLQPEGSDLPLLALACAARRSAFVVDRLVNPQVNVRVHLPLHDGSSHEQGGSQNDTTASSPRAAGRKQAAALHFAVMYEDTELVRALVTRKDHTNVNVRRSGDGFTPLHIACGMGNMEVIKFLLDYGASFIQMSTVSSKSSGVTPLHLLIKEDGVENDKLKELIQHGYITREMLLEGLGAPAMVSTKSAKQDEPRGAHTTSSSGKTTPETQLDKHGEEDENEMEISCVLLDEEEHNLSLYTHVQQLLEANRGATGFCMRLQSELTKSDDVLTQFFNLLSGKAATTVSQPNPRKGSSSFLELVTEEETVEELTPRVPVVAMMSPAEEVSLQATRFQFAQLKHWHECYAQQTVRSQYVSSAPTPKMLRRSSFDRRSTRQLLLETDNDAGEREGS